MHIHTQTRTHTHSNYHTRNVIFKPCIHVLHNKDGIAKRRQVDIVEKGVPREKKSDGLLYRTYTI